MLKMKKLNSKGFVLAETLVVSVFLITIFTMIYTNFYPVIGEYEKRETYDDVDGKYVAYWVKKLVESSAYNVSTTYNSGKAKCMKQYGFMRFECSDVDLTDQQRSVCVNLVRSLEVANCDRNGDGCEIYITHYKLISNSSPSFVSFKDNVLKKELKRKDVYKQYNSTDGSNGDSCNKSSSYLEYCKCKNAYDKADATLRAAIVSECNTLAEKKVFSSSMRDYIQTLPDYITPSLNMAKYRVIVMIRHRKDGNNYYSFANMEVRK